MAWALGLSSEHLLVVAAYEKATAMTTTYDSLPSFMGEEHSSPDEQEERPRALPEVLLAEDIAGALRVSTSSARRLIRSGACGPWAYMGRRLVVRRSAFLEAIRQREEVQTAQVRAQRQGARFHHLLFGKDEGE